MLQKVTRKRCILKQNKCYKFVGKPQCQKRPDVDLLEDGAPVLTNKWGVSKHPGDIEIKWQNSMNFPMPLQNGSKHRLNGSGDWLGRGRAMMQRANVEVNDSYFDNKPDNSPNNNSGLKGGKLAGVVVGSVAGGLLFVVILGLLIRCLCQRRKVSSNQENPGSNSVPNPKPPRSGSVWSFFPKRGPKLAPPVVSSKRVSVPIFHSDKLDDEFSDTSFVLPELGGPNPHNKFDGMSWVDIKGMDDDVLVEISTDLRKYQQHQRQ